jgi:hypothetical protein
MQIRQENGSLVVLVKIRSRQGAMDCLLTVLVIVVWRGNRPI